MNKVLKKLGIVEFNYGASSSYNNCIKNEDQKLISSYNPSDGTLLSSVYKSSISDLDNIIIRSSEAYNEFKKIPAPIRGELIREMSTALRAIDSTKFQSAPSSSWSALSSASLLQTTDGKSVVPTSFWSREEVAVVVLFRSYG